MSKTFENMKKRDRNVPNWIAMLVTQHPDPELVGTSRAGLQVGTYRVGLLLEYQFRKLGFIEKIIQIKNKKKTLILIPIRKDLQHNGQDKSYKNLYWYKQLTDLAEKNNTKVIDLYDFLNLNVQYKYFHNCDIHWSNFGNESVANFFLQHL